MSAARTIFARRLQLALALALALCVLATLFAAPLHAQEPDSAVQVQLDAKAAAPRAIESLTERRVLQDYRLAWASMAHALEFNVTDPLEGPFAGEAKQSLRETVANQQHSGLSERYVGQNHKLEAVFYAPEGDVIELHDTADYQLQVLDGSKTIHDQHVILHYVVLMTPAADRWVIRQLQAVPAF